VHRHKLKRNTAIDSGHREKNKMSIRRTSNFCVKATISLKYLLLQNFVGIKKRFFINRHSQCIRFLTRLKANFFEEANNKLFSG